MSCETPQGTHERLLKVLAAAELKVFDGTYTFVESPVADGLPAEASGALALVRDEDVWSALVPSQDASRELFRVFSFHFRDGMDNSGFVGWLATRLKTALGTGVFVVCGQNSARGGIFDYWGCPAALGDAVLKEVTRLAASRGA